MKWRYIINFLPIRAKIALMIHCTKTSARVKVNFSSSSPYLDLVLERKIIIKFNRKVLHAVADPGFLRGASSSKVRVLSYYLVNFSPKTTGKCKKLDPEKGACLQSSLPPGSANDMSLSILTF